MATKTMELTILNSFLRGEFSAVEAYRLAIEKLGNNPIREKLAQAQSSHQKRAELLRQWILQHGGNPSQGAGPWGALAKLMEGGARVFGEKAAVTALAQEEAVGLQDYRMNVNNLDTEAKDFVEAEILPLQQKSHDDLAALNKGLASPYFALLRQGYVGRSAK